MSPGKLDSNLAAHPPARQTIYFSLVSNDTIRWNPAFSFHCCKCGSDIHLKKNDSEFPFSRILPVLSVGSNCCSGHLELAILVFRAFVRQAGALLDIVGGVTRCALARCIQASDGKTIQKSWGQWIVWIWTNFRTCHIRYLSIHSTSTLCITNVPRMGGIPQGFFMDFRHPCTRCKYYLIGNRQSRWKRVYSIFWWSVQDIYARHKKIHTILLINQYVYTLTIH